MRSNGAIWRRVAVSMPAPASGFVCVARLSPPVWSLARMAGAMGVGTLGRPAAGNLGCLTGLVNGSRVETQSIPPTARTSFGTADRGLHHDHNTARWTSQAHRATERSGVPLRSIRQHPHRHAVVD